MPYHVKILKIKGKDHIKKEINITFPIKGERLAKIFPKEKIFSATNLTKAILEALKIGIEELLAKYGYDEARLKYAGVRFVEILYFELVYLYDIKNYENRYQVILSTEEQ